MKNMVLNIRCSFGKDDLMKVQIGSKVKILDIGPLATCIGLGRGYLVCELDGEQFKISKSLVKVIER